ncbi:hypothetical protein V7152_05995 [Neobacillus drentensis]|uniref:hypothetical protein n=1 Tax=Neobacillus drentensis TaxID=220684 RepID=UPI002FFFC730
MKFQYRLTGAGWAQCELEINLKKYSFGAGYLTDALGDFLKTLLNINPLYTEEVYIENGAQFFWDEEPRGTEWHFRYLGDDKMSLEITEYEDISSSFEPKIMLQTECSYTEFLIQVMSEAARILNEYGIVGYKEMWYEHEFPLSSFLKLKYYIKNNSKFPLENRKAGHTEIYKSDLETELNNLIKK